MSGVTAVFLGMLAKPFVMLFFMLFMALGVWLAKRFAPGWLRRILLRKLW